jgi:hypothetical protein
MGGAWVSPNSCARSAALGRCYRGRGSAGGRVCPAAQQQWARVGAVPGRSRWDAPASRRSDCARRIVFRRRLQRGVAGVGGTDGSVGREAAEGASMLLTCLQAAAPEEWAGAGKHGLSGASGVHRSFVELVEHGHTRPLQARGRQWWRRTRGKETRWSGQPGAEGGAGSGRRGESVAQGGTAGGGNAVGAQAQGVMAVRRARWSGDSPSKTMVMETPGIGGAGGMAAPGGREAADGWSESPPASSR